MNVLAVPQRNGDIDKIKGILIFLVVLGHSIQYFIYGGTGFWGDRLFRIIYIFHMPMFMLISGYLAKRSIDRRDLSHLIISRAQQLVLPLVVWVLLYRMGLVLLAIVRGRGLPPDLFLILSNDLSTSFWFLWALFISIIVVGLLAKFQCSGFVGLFSAACMSVLLLPEYFVLTMFKFVFPFFLIGYAVPDRILEGWGDDMKTWLVVVFLMIAALLIFSFWHNDYYVYVSGMNVDVDNLNNVLFRWIAACVYCALFLILFRLIRGIIPEFLAFIGRKTLIIYILQTFVFAPMVFLGGFPAWKGSVFMPVVMAAVVLLFSLFFSRLLEMSTLLKCVLCGKFHAQ